MAAMYGRIGAYGERTCGCCDLGRDKRSQRMVEETRWRRDYIDELTSPEPVYGWEHDGPDEWESRDLLHRLADDKTIAKYMGSRA